jgi:hypothetical protein
MGYLIFQNSNFIISKPRARSHPFKIKCPATTGRTETKTRYHNCQFCQLLANPDPVNFRLLTRRRDDESDADASQFGPERLA